LGRGPGRIRTRTVSVIALTERGAHWGIVPSYFSWQGKLVETESHVEAAILDAMDARSARPRRLQRPPLPRTRCETGPERAWGWAVQLYALRSRQSWGIGDLSDLRRFASWSRSAGASVVLLNPLGAQNPMLPYEASPYYASTRRFRNVIFLRVDEVDGADEVDIATVREDARALNEQRIIDYDRVYQLKSAALEKIHAAAPQPPGLDAFKRRQGRALRDFATFCALCEKHGPAWRSWPTDSGGPSPTRIAYHEWLQFHLDRQLRRASREIGLITDVPVGFAPDGFDAWRWRKLLAPGMRVGAPPDEFFRDGQDWGLPPFNPWKLGDAGWEPFLDGIRSAGRHAAGIRLDHVMNLFRLFWIPDGVAPTRGAYVRYPAEILLSLLANESHRAHAFVIGEDLGLVEPVVRKQLERKGSLSYRLVWFEATAPAEWPHDAVAAITTHDLPTVAGIWTRSEPEQRLHYLRDKLVQIAQLPDDADPVDVAIAVHAQLARGQTRIVLASLEDALGVHERPNVPGTTGEFPNWRLALPLTLEDIQDARGTRGIVSAMMDAGRSGSGES
jgi:4-alpha-glucanotransferase